MTFHAFVDESCRNQTYVLCAASIQVDHLAGTRKQLRGLLLPGQRELHFKHERGQRRRMLADRIARMPVSVTIYVSTVTRRTQEKARQLCVGRCLQDVLDRGGQRLIFDSREQQDVSDRATIYRELGSRLSALRFTYAHLNSKSVPELWIPDAVAWCYGAGGDWKRRVAGIITETIEL